MTIMRGIKWDRRSVRILDRWQNDRDRKRRVGRRRRGIEFDSWQFRPVSGCQWASARHHKWAARRRTSESRSDLAGLKKLIVRGRDIWRTGIDSLSGLKLNHYAKDRPTFARRILSTAPTVLALKN